MYLSLPVTYLWTPIALLNQSVDRSLQGMVDSAHPTYVLNRQETKRDNARIRNQFCSGRTGRKGDCESGRQCNDG